MPMPPPDATSAQLSPTRAHTQPEGLLRSVDPSSGRVVAVYPAHSDEEMDLILEAAASAQESWRQRDTAERARVLRSVAARLGEAAEDYAALITLEMGKPLTESRAEIEKCRRTCEHYAEHGPGMLEDVVVHTEARISRITYEPLGLLLAVMPWNYPFWQVIRCLAPALLAGNGMILKHAPNVSGCALALERLVADVAGEPNLMRVMLVDEPRVQDVVGALISDRRVSAVTATASGPAGRSVATAAGQATKKSVLELGGSDPLIVLEDADIHLTARAAAAARFANAGQSCLAPKRVIVHSAVAEQFESAFAREVQAMPVGHPHSIDTRIGPLARRDLVDQLDRQVQESLRSGARLVLGGHRLDHQGNYYAATVLADVKPTMPVFREETFGPVAALTVAETDQEAVALANDTHFGLGASVWTSDTDRGLALCRSISSGMAFVNAIPMSDPRLPFGGIKASGHGRELGVMGMFEFVNVRTLWVDAPHPQ